MHTNTASVTDRRTSLSLILIGTFISTLVWLPAQASALPYDPQSSADVENRIKEYFADIPAMAAVAKCESGNRQFNASGNVLFDPTYTWMGAFQISRIHLPRAVSLGMDVRTLEGNMAFARVLYNESGMQPWVSSKHCWRLAAGATAAANLAAPTRLSYGSVSTGVIELQKMLNRAGFIVAASGPGSPGNETTKFGMLTREAVRRFQCAKGIVCSGTESTTGYGLAGPRTLAALRTAEVAIR